MTRHRFVFLVGPSGSGKTVLARVVAGATGYGVIDTDDELLEASECESISEIFDKYGEQEFRKRESTLIRGLGSRPGNFIVATGGGLPAIPGMTSLLQELGVSIYLRAALDELWERLSENDGELAKRPLLRDGGKQKLASLMVSRRDAYEASSASLDTDALFVEEVGAMIVALVNEGGRRDPQAT